MYGCLKFLLTCKIIEKKPEPLKHVVSHEEYAQLEALRGLLDKFKSEGLKPPASAYNAVIEWYLKHGSQRPARNYYVEMTQLGLVPDTYILRLLSERPPQKKSMYL